MDEIFEKLTAVPGVVSITVRAPDGEVFSKRGGGEQFSFDVDSLIPSIEELGYLLDFLGDSGGPEVVLQGTTHQALLKRDAGALIVLVVERSANIAAVYVTLTSTLAKIKTHLSSGRGSGRASPLERQQGGAPLTQRSVASAPVRNNSQSGPAVVSGSRLKQLSLIGDWDAGKIPADAVGLKFVNHMYAVLEEYFGDGARETLVREMKALSVSPSTLSVRVVQDLIDRVVAVLEDPRARKELRAKILGDR